MPFTVGAQHLRWFALLAGSLALLAAGPLQAAEDKQAPAAPPAYDPAKYMSPDEIRRGMKGFGRTVLAGTEIQTFEFEVLSVMKNAFEPRQDVILVRCSGLGLEKTGVIEGMSGSPCYVQDDQGRERMIGAVAFGWPLSKEPICGVQPITQMLGIPAVRDPANRPRPPATNPATGPAATVSGQGLSMGELLAAVHPDPIDTRSRLSIFNDDIARLRSLSPRTPERELRPLALPVMVSGAGTRTRAWIEKRFEPLGLRLVTSGAASEADKASAGAAGFRPGSVLCVPLMTGDLSMDVIGTCTEVIDNKVLGFGHALFARGFTELPLATGMVHTVFPSVLASFKLGAGLKTVGTLWGDEQTGVFGICGASPVMAPLKVTIRDERGPRTFQYQMARDRAIGATLVGSAVAGSIFSHNELPDDHVIKYRIQIEFEGVGTYETRNFTSLAGVSGVAEDLMVPVMLMSWSPFGEAPIARGRIDIEIESGTRSVRIDRLQLPRLTYRPGETVSARVRYQHTRSAPMYTEATYDLTIPQDLPDGEYALTVGSADTQLEALRQEKPHKLRAENLPDLLDMLNYVTSFPQNRLYMRLEVPKGGMAVGRLEMPELPSFRQKILMDSRRPDIVAYTEALVVEQEADFTVNGSLSTAIKVSRKKEY
ncbi:MAG TPA: hypothetical protein VLM89_04145 [Phycisphaerae bacterium]|nr:hypothetical protein [Phycisphaerae bacterium]